ncbi:DUF3810 family protein [Mucilaginibacter gotjawali]|uniref:Uncharacterized protein n=2 Tax=Mucilaginibacter gotjawali TaxID=1550579 RepID=A0A839SK47_9SPHI|nr:DUF3810 family protein [Mucilaginibacter gotjawali]MBB3057798.1 hypothetical protein [Mucilaginibacter gotjawali]BAU52600.1 hypothetical protein MgSA37_00762 [Mucilaginibacter gotjawali]
MKLTPGKKKLMIRIGVIVALEIINILLMWLANYPKLVERYYAEGFYPVICKILHPVFNIFPFSVGDVFYILVSAYLLYALFRLIKLAFKRQFKQAVMFLLALIIVVQTGILVFYLFWGMNYFRPGAGERLNLRDTGYTTENLVKVTNMLIDSANVARARINPADLQQNNDSIYHTAIAAVKRLSADSANFRTWYPRVKSSLLTPLMNYMGTSGYYDPFTGEAQMNSQMPLVNRPFVACHELSHQVGFATEDEANFGGFIAGINSPDRLLRYSAYNLAVEECMYALFFRDSLQFKKLKPRLSLPVRNDYKAERLYWQKYESRLNRISGIFYDHFLKHNNQPQGLGTYNRMVLLVMAKYRPMVEHGARADSTEEKFDSFFSKFQTDSVFQKSRIVFPLKYKVSSDEGESGTVKFIPKNKLSYFGLFVANGKKGIIKQINLNPATVKIQFQIKDTGYQKDFTFVKKRGQWQLVFIEDNSD